MTWLERQRQNAIKIRLDTMASKLREPSNHRWEAAGPRPRIHGQRPVFKLHACSRVGTRRNLWDRRGSQGPCTSQDATPGRGRGWPARKNRGQDRSGRPEDS